MLESPVGITYVLYQENLNCKIDSHNASVNVLIKNSKIVVFKEEKLHNNLNLVETFKKITFSMTTARRCKYETIL